MLGASAGELLAVAATAVALYVTTFALTRLAGRRTVSKMSAFDAVITVALGSVFATSVVSAPPSYGRGAVAVVTLLCLQVAVGALRQRVPGMRRLLDFPVQHVFDRGDLRLDRSLRGAQVTAEEVDAAIRSAGFTERDHVVAVVLESDGSFSVIPRTDRD